MGTDEYSKLDLVIWGGGAGGSSAYLQIDDFAEPLAMMHFLGNPYEAIANATAELVEGREASSFFWFDEPAITHVFDFVRSGELPSLRGRYRAYSGGFSGSIPEFAIPYHDVSFTTDLPLWVTLVQTSLSRARELSRYPQHPSWKDVEVPGRELSILETYLHHLRSRRK